MSQNPSTGDDQIQPAPRLLIHHPDLVDRFYQESGAESWGLSRSQFASALDNSVAKSFPSGPDSRLEGYLSALHLADLALSCACALGSEPAWEHFVSTYQPYLRASAAVLLRSSATAPHARDLADSLFADLYGVKGSSSAGPSLFRYFHGRSSLKTWLRAVLAQRHVDAIRADRRFTELDATDEPQSTPVSPPASTENGPADPHRPRYISLFSAALQSALGSLPPRDLSRLRLYYAEQRTLAEIGRLLDEHESSVSRNLDRLRRELRSSVEKSLRSDLPASGRAPAQPGLSDVEIALCFEYAAEDAPIDFDRIFPRTPASRGGLEP